MQAIVWALAVLWPPALGAAVWCQVGTVAGILATVVAYLAAAPAVLMVSLELPNQQGLRRALTTLHVLWIEAAPALVVTWIAGQFNY